MIADFERRGQERGSVSGFRGDGVCVVVCGRATEAVPKFKFSAHSDDNKMLSNASSDGEE